MPKLPSKSPRRAPQGNRLRSPLQAASAVSPVVTTSASPSPPSPWSLYSRLLSSGVRSEPSPHRNTIAVAVGTTVLICAEVLLLLGLFREWRRNKITLCVTSGCEQFAKLFADAINWSVDPCANFDAYVCSGWRTRQQYSVYEQLIANAVDKMTNVVNKDANVPATGQSILQKATVFYRSCDMVWRGERDEVPVIRECFRRAGILWPSRSPAPNVLRTLFSLSIEFNWAVVINVVPVRNSLWILVPYSLVLAAEEQERRQELDSRRRTFELISAHFSEGGADSVVAFEEANDLEEAFFNPLDDARINSEVPALDSKNLEEDKWITLLDEFNVTAVSKLQAFNRNYLMTFVDLWKKHGEDKTHVFISWMAARYASLFANYELVSNYYGTTNKDFIKYMHGHWCYELAYVFFGDFLFAPYNALVFQPDVRRDVEDIALNIRNVFQARLSKRLTYPVHAYMEVLWSSLETVLSALTTTVHQTENESIEINSLLPNMNLSLTRNWEAAWKTTRRASNATPPQKLGWRAVHMFLPYDLRFGDFVIAPYILLFPFYDINVVDAVKYGALGAHMAKASVDVFLNNYAISNLTDQAVEDALGCASISDTTKATKTLSDVTSLDVLVQVFAAYGSQWILAGLNSLTATQLLFIAWCYIRCRVYSEPLGDECNTAVKHVTAFSTAFTCTSGAPLNVEKKCSIF